MKTKTNLSQGGHKYQAPAFEVMNVITEGVFCQSQNGTMDIADWAYDEQGALDF